MRQRPDRIGRPCLRVLAALLLVDGRILSLDDLADIALPWGGMRETVRCLWVSILRRHGCQIETGPSPQYGYWLAAMPPDDLLEDVLVVAHQLCAEQPTRLWQHFGRQPTTAIRRSRTRAVA